MIIVTPLTILLPRIPALGVSGVFWAEAISNVAGGLACFGTMLFTVYRPLSLLSEKQKEKVNAP